MPAPYGGIIVDSEEDPSFSPPFYVNTNMLYITSVNPCNATVFAGFVLVRADGEECGDGPPTRRLQPTNSKLADPFSAAKEALQNGGKTMA